MCEQNAAALDNSSGRAMRVFEGACLAAAVGLIVTHVVRFARTPELSPWPAALAVLLAIPAADFLSGFVHWAGDTWGRVTTRWLGPRFLVPFRYHHLRPGDMLKSHFVTTNGDSALVSCFILGAALLIPLHSTGVIAVFVAAVGAWGLPTSQIHKWAHDPRPPRVVRWLQRAGLILSPDRHSHHHRFPFAGHYCITTGWCNPVLERLRFWRALEWAVSRLTGLTPRDDVDVKRPNGEG
jgi:plasmanylethanolamine desaturase